MVGVVFGVVRKFNVDYFGVGGFDCFIGGYDVWFGVGVGVEDVDRVIVFFEFYCFQ